MEKCFVCGDELDFDPTLPLVCQPIPIGDREYVCPHSKPCFERAENEGIVTPEVTTPAA